MKCVREECTKNEQYCRGLCRSHYQFLQYVVFNGMRTWEELEAAGECNVYTPVNKRKGMRSYKP